MSDRVEKAFELLRSLGTPDQLRSLADEGYGTTAPCQVNAHIHLPPNFSAFESVEQAIDLASQQQVGILGVSNYYNYEVYGDFVELARDRGIFPLFGLEIIAMQDDLREEGIKLNDPGNPGKTYVCGKGITRFGRMTEEGDRLLGLIRRGDKKRMQSMIARLKSVFAEKGLDFEVDEDWVIDMVVRRHGSPRDTVYLQERHISQAFQELLGKSVPGDEQISRLNEVLGAETKAGGPQDEFVIQNDIRTHLLKAGKPAFVDEEFVSFQQAKQLILEMGGIPCYPTLADGASPICPFEEDIDVLIDAIQTSGVYAAEWILPRNTIEVAREYVTRMRAAGLVLTAGTEHNTLDLIPIPPFCSDGAVPEDLQAIFWEGACVVAAHQFLTLHGQCGYVDGTGALNSQYASTEERITQLAQLGAAVIARYQEACSAVI